MINITENKREFNINRHFEKQKKKLVFDGIPWENLGCSFKTPFSIQSIQTALIGSVEVFKQIIRYRNGTHTVLYFVGKDSYQIFYSEEKLLDHIRIIQNGSL